MLKAATNCWGRFRWAWPARGGLPAIVHPAVHLLDSHLTLDLQHLPLERLQSLAINMLQVELTDDAQSVLQALAPLAARLGQVGLTLAAARQQAWTVSGEVLPALAAALGPTLKAITLSEASVDATFWPGLLQALPSLPQLAQVLLHNPTDLGQQELGAFCAAVPAGRELAIKVRCELCEGRDRFSMIAEQVQGMLQQLPGPRAVRVVYGW
uniref:Uncharacterized protein n=1 Tax=Chlamydomonas leiostraca TaxID=1034604 RepID=A0A7S0WNK1_9CHLO|mmetsp:Transcript_20501/g.51979  ORF Transcript_20501/g.51979 Transcript_20501/m.51979 type:complete len:211 (+) Transcript_20501:514-1146(+)